MHAVHQREYPLCQLPERHLEQMFDHHIDLFLSRLNEPQRRWFVALEAIGQAVPYGVYEVWANQGFVCVGDCFDTPRFAVDTTGDWWFAEGGNRYREAHRLLILADAGGSNSYRSRGWKAKLQELSDIAVMPIRECHYPLGCSKWNPLEHRLFRHISMNWTGVPLRTCDTMMKYIEGAETCRLAGESDPQARW